MSVGSNKQDTQSQSQTQSDSFVWGQQIPFLQDLWSAGAGVADPTGAQRAQQGVVDGLMPTYRGVTENIAGLADPTKQIAAQTASLNSGLNQLWSEQMVPGIQTDAIAAGGFGGGRQGVAEGVAAGQIANAYTQGVGDITARANQTALGAGALMPSLGQAQTALAQSPYAAPMDILGQLAAIIGSPTILQTSRGEQSSTGRTRGWNFGLPEVSAT